MDLVIKHGTVVTASEIMGADVGIKGGKMLLWPRGLTMAHNRTMQRENMFSGRVEIHTHLDGILHGMRTVDDWYVSSVGAAFGGTTTIVDFPMPGKEQSLRESSRNLRKGLPEKVLLILLYPDHQSIYGRNLSKKSRN